VGWVISRADGEPITDGKRLAEGLFMPVGTYKGSGLAIVLGLLGGPLNRAAFGRDVRDSATEQTSETNTGHFMIALDPKRFLPLDLFKAEIDRHVHDLANSKRLPGVDEIRIPGQGRIMRRADREQNGVPLAESLITQVDEMAKTLGIETLSGRGEAQVPFAPATNLASGGNPVRPASPLAPKPNDSYRCLKNNTARARSRSGWFSHP